MFMAAESAPEGTGHTSEGSVALRAGSLISAGGVLTPTRKDPSAREQTALNGQRLARHERRRVAAQPGDGARDLLRAAHPPHGHVGGQRLAEAREALEG